MRANIANMMRKMSGGDLGKLLLKDMTAGLGGGSCAYTIEDFEAVAHRLDWHNRREYMKYIEIVQHISVRLMYGWWLCSVIEKLTLRFDVVFWIMRLNRICEIASDFLLFQRLSYGTSESDWRDPGEEETHLREKSKQLIETFLENKEGIAEMRNTLITFVKRYLTFDQTMRSLAEMLDMPEIASIVESPLHHVEELKRDIQSALETLREDTYSEILPEIDIGSLEPDMAEVESYISNTAELLKA